MEFKITNKFGQNISISIEPEGTIVELADGKSIFVRIESEDNPILDLQINRQKTGFYLSIWPEKGKFEVLEQ